MTKRILLIFFSFLFMVGLAAFSPALKIVYRYNAFLACEKTDSISITKADFEKLVSSKLCAHDSANNVFPVASFEIIYAERGLFEDSTGLPIVFTDYSNQTCKGDSIPMKWQNDFKERGYKGDTVFFDRIIVTDKNKSNLCKRIKCVIR
jgi:hypothetical protein